MHERTLAAPRRRSRRRIGLPSPPTVPNNACCSARFSAGVSPGFLSSQRRRPSLTGLPKCNCEPHQKRLGSATPPPRLATPPPSGSTARPGRSASRRDSMSPYRHPTSRTVTERTAAPLVHPVLRLVGPGASVTVVSIFAIFAPAPDPDATASWPSETGRWTRTTRARRSASQSPMPPPVVRTNDHPYDSPVSRRLMLRIAASIQRRRIHVDRRPSPDSLRLQPLQHPREHRVTSQGGRLVRDRRVTRWRRHVQIQDARSAQRIFDPPHNPAGRRPNLEVR